MLLVHDEHLGRDIALKELFPEFATEVDDSPAPSPVRKSVPFIARFLQEARITGQLEHPSIVPVYALDYRKDGSLYYTMKLVRGKSLAQAIKAAGTLRERLGLLSHFVDLCQAMAYAHSRHIIHRDLKPANVMVGEFWETVVLDWGLAKSKDREDVHADVYSLGAVLYQILTGKTPFTGKSVHEIIHKVLNDIPQPIGELEDGVPPELVAICTRALSKDKKQRYQSAKELAKEVRRFQAGALVQAYEYGFSEHLRRFAGKHTAVLTACTAGLLLVIGVGIFFNFRLIESRDLERQQRIVEEDARAEARSQSYISGMYLAEKYIEDGRFDLADSALLGAPMEF